MSNHSETQYLAPAQSIAEARSKTRRYDLDYIDACGGDILAGLMFAQVGYWFTANPDTGKTRLRKKRADGQLWLKKSVSDWQAELRFTRRNVEHANAILIEHGLVSIELDQWGKSKAYHYRLTAEGFSLVQSVRVKDSSHVQSVHITDNTTPSLNTGNSTKVKDSADSETPLSAKPYIPEIFTPGQEETNQTSPTPDPNSPVALSPSLSPIAEPEHQKGKLYALLLWDHLMQPYADTVPTTLKIGPTQAGAMKKVVEGMAESGLYVDDLIRHVVGDYRNWIRFLAEVESAAGERGLKVWPNQQAGLSIFLKHCDKALAIMPDDWRARQRKFFIADRQRRDALEAA